jgi:hypothetical protein
VSAFEPERDERLDQLLTDLDVPDGDEVTGGSLNAYIESVNGEKQGTFKGG